MNLMKLPAKNLRLPTFLAILLLFLTVYPYLHQKFTNQIAIIEVFFSFLLISGASLLVNNKKYLFIMIVLAATVLIGIVINGHIHDKNFLIFIMIIEFVFFAIIFFSLLGFIYAQQIVNLDKIYAAVTGYLILGILFAVLYTIVSIISPSSFQYTVSVGTAIQKIFPHPAFFTEALYFSFVTLSTLGYGDWIPISGPIKMIATLEAIIGQLYIAILIARLVGIQILQSLKNS